ncbi:MAG: hypothetical protein KDB27_25905, partial [Planctomycetales bacterium]|nr:hypothetical protein [Planctomycetales bacterium]
MKRTAQLALALFLCGSVFWAPVRAERPNAIKFLPDWTVALVQIPDSREFSREMRTSGFAKMLNDDEVRPFVESLYGSATDIVGKIEDTIGMTLEQVLEIPAGEVSIAVVAPPALTPELVVVMDLDPDNSDGESLLDQGADVLRQGGYDDEQLTEGTTELTIFRRGGGGDGPKEIVRFQEDNAVIMTTSLRVAKRMIENLGGGDKENLTDNAAFMAIKNRCEADGESSVFWFADPIRFFRSATKGDTGAQVALAVLPALGLDGLKGIGGNAVIPEDDPEIESISHLHIYMENPRDGVLDMITMKTGDSRPESWAPKNLINYMTFHTDVQKSYSTLKDLYDSFREEGDFGRLVKKNISDNIGIDFEQDFIAELHGRITVLQRYERPPRLGSQSSLVAFKLHRVDRFQDVFDAVVEKFEKHLEPRAVAGHEVYVTIINNGIDLEVERAIENDENAERRDRRRARRRRIRAQAQPRPSFAIIDDYFIVADRPSFIEKIIETQNAGDGLSTDEEF